MAESASDSEEPSVLPRKRRRLYDTLSADEEVALTQVVVEHKAEQERLYARKVSTESSSGNSQSNGGPTADYKRDQAWRIINQSMKRVGTIALLPVPLIDLAAVTYIQTDMLRKLARTFELDYHEPLVLNIVGKVWKAYYGFTLGTSLAGSAAKMIPFVGSMIGMATVNYSAVGSTYSLGKLVIDENL